MRGKKVLFVALIVAGLIPAVVYSAESEKKEPLVAFYDSSLIKVSYLTFGGVSLQAQGFSSSIMMGVSDNIRNLLAKYPESKVGLESYESKNRIGNILLWGGLAAALGGAYYPILAINGSDSSAAVENKWKTGIYIALGGLAAELIGAFVLPSSFQDLFNSVNSYNRQAVRDYKAE